MKFNLLQLKIILKRKINVYEVAVFVQISEKSCHTVVSVSYGANSKCAGKLWLWRIEWCIKPANPTLWGRRGGFWSRWMAQNIESCPSNRLTKIRDYGPFSDFKSCHVGPRVSDLQVLPTIRCARIRAFQRTSNYCRTTHLRPYGNHFLNFGQELPLHKRLKCHLSNVFFRPK